MTDEEILSEVKREWEHWTQHFNLGNWWVRFETVRDTDYSVQLDYKRGGYRDVVVKVSVDDDAFKQGISKVVVHEMVHLMLFPFHDFGWSCVLPTHGAYFQECEEQVADEMAMVIWRLHEQTGCGKEGEGLMESMFYGPTKPMGTWKPDGSFEFTAISASDNGAHA